jgi:hypothetical protein
MNVRSIFITGKQIVVATDFCLLRNREADEARFPIQQLTIFGMIMYLREMNELLKIRGLSCVFNKWRPFGISDIDYRFGCVNGLVIKVSLKQNTGVWKVFFLLPDSPFEAMVFNFSKSQNA